MDRFTPVFVKVTCAALIVCCLLPLAGCLSLVANLIHAAKGDLIPAAFDQFEDRKVAVVCVSNSSFFGPTSVSSDVGKRVARLLRQKIPKAIVIPQQQVDDWIDKNSWDAIDFVALGKGVEADLVIAIEVNSLSLYDGKTMYKGQADMQFAVYDMQQGGAEVFGRPSELVQFPVNSGISVNDVSSERQFRESFLDVIAMRVARNFFAFDINDDYARDADMLTIGQ
jgi:hypothetical protein